MHRLLAVAPEIGRLLLQIDDANEAEQDAPIEEAAVQHVHHLDVAALALLEERELPAELGGRDPPGLHFEQVE